MLRRTLVCCLLIVCGLPLSAQTGTSVITGTVTNEDQPLPGALVVLEGEVLQGQREIVTNDKGLFRFALLPPGSGYRIRVTMTGFQTAVRKDVNLPLGKTVKLTIPIQPQSVTDELVVTAEVPMIDTTTNQISHNFSAEFLETVTNNRQMQMVMAMTPGALEGNNPSMLGGSSTDNIYLVDGADNTDPLSKTWGTQINFDAIQDIQVITGGVSAEYGRGQGAVVNLVTKSGGNRFEGNVRFLKSDVEWNEDADGKTFDESTRYTTEDRIAMTLGGPIIKDRLWFFAAFETRGKEKQTFHYANLEAFESQDLTRQTTNSPTYEGHYLNLKLTYQATPNHSLVLAYNEDPIEFPLHSYLNYEYYGNPFTVNREQGGDTMMFEWNWNINAVSYLSARVQRFDSNLNNVPADSSDISTALRPVHQFVSAEAGTFYTNTSPARSNYRSDREFDSYTATYNYFLDAGKGTHNLKIGAEVRDSSYGSGDDLWNGGHRMYWNERSDWAAFLIYTDDRPTALTSESYGAIFLQDEWTVNERLTFNLGLRAESLKFDNVEGREIVNQKLGDMISPRVGFAYTLDKGSLHGSFARYYDAIGDWVVDNSQPDQEYTREWYWLNPAISDLVAQGLRPWENPADWAQINIQDHPDMWEYRTTSTFGPSGTTQILGTLDPSYMDEFTLGYDYQLTPMYAVGVNTYHRTWQNAYEDADFAQTGDWIFQTVDGEWRKYQALILSAQKRLGPDGFQFFTSYTYSKTRGRSSSDNSTLYLDSPYQVNNWYGKVLDVPHSFKFNGSYAFDGGFTVGVNYILQSGSTFTPEISILNQIPDGINEDTYEEVWYESRGSRRMENYTRTDLHLEYAFKLFNGRVSPSIYLDIFNVLNDRRVVDVDNFIGYGSFTTDAEPGSEAYLEYVQNNSPVLDEFAENFGEATEYSFPRSYYVGFNVKF
ncbi:TonB-dependent receptor [Sulfidibacter corallicola]|uniref:TonB-dependent receptor n=1 Tax=Sulfidibacter corallicola TaxID=2818388 RepID=A0A8A4TS09_SULCO|nr:TonB-dependent receptor [Sulfidibacter corallicola]QTD52177.1 TonB-dependent receptor [Sulfidibacter corallicola]